MNINIQGYLNTVRAPWGQLFYKMIWNHLSFERMDILDFGSGFGITADYLASGNRVTAIGPNGEMLANRSYDHPYQQLVGGMERLKELPEQSYDVILCHNVLEYLHEREEVLREFHRLLKKDGILSLVKHNRAGKVMQKVVFENQIEEALGLIAEKNAVSANFGTVRVYSMQDLEKYAAGLYDIQKVYGIRMFFGLQSNEWKTDPAWVQNMFRIESAVEEIPAFRDIAYFHHVILKKQGSALCS